MHELRFAKGHGLGNDYIVVDRRDLAFELTPAHVRALCDRNRGIGGDGLLLADVSAAGYALRIFNPDGSEAEKSGNGLRIFGAYLHNRGLVGSDWFNVRLIKDQVAMRVEEVLPNSALMIRVQMGRAVFAGRAVGFKPQPAEALDYELALADGGSARINTVSLSNPHCVVFVERLDRADFNRRAPQLCQHRAFEAGTNVQFAHVVTADRIEAWIYERGVGETLASGSSSCAVAAAAVRRGFMKPGLITVQMPGGAAEVEVTPDYEVKLRGPAQIVFTGSVGSEVVEGW